MLKGVARERGVVCLDIHLEVLVKSVLTQEADRGRRVKVVLVLHGLLGLGLDVEVTREADAAAVFNSHFHQGCDIFLLKLHVGVQQRFIAFTTAPEHVASAAELDGQLQSLLDLCRRKAVNVHRVGAARAAHEAGVGEHICRTPQALDVGALHFFKDVIGDLVKATVGLLDVISLGYKVDVVEAEVLDAELLHKLKARIHLCLGVCHRAFFGVEALVGGVSAEHIGACGAKVVPPSHREGQMLAHLFAKDDSVSIIVAECKGIFAVLALKFDFGNVLENFSHGRLLLLFHIFI